MVTTASSDTRTLRPEVSTVPPPPVAGEEASSVPPTLAVPPSARKTMRPLRSSIVRACTMPVLLTWLPSSSSAAFAVRITVPPSAWMAPLFSTSAPSAPSSMLRLTSESPLKLRLIFSPLPSATVPLVATITPWFDTERPSSAT